VRSSTKKSSTVEIQDNARLLRDLEKRLGASSLGSICGFFEAGTGWRCPCCHRSKVELARLDRNRNLLCALHWHHDHFGDYASDKLPRVANATDNLIESFCRFPNTLICSDCNVAEPAAKQIVNAKPYFSFAPFEIATFITVRPNAGHLVDDARVRTAYEAAKPALLLVWNRLKAVMDSARNEDEDFQHIGGPAWRVLKEANAKRKNPG
jgi:hypothetical protein